MIVGTTESIPSTLLASTSTVDGGKQEGCDISDDYDDYDKKDKHKKKDYGHDGCGKNEYDSYSDDKKKEYEYDCDGGVYDNNDNGYYGGGGYGGGDGNNYYGGGNGYGYDYNNSYGVRQQLRWWLWRWL